MSWRQRRVVDGSALDAERDDRWLFHANAVVTFGVIYSASVTRYTVVTAAPSDTVECTEVPVLADPEVAERGK